MVSSSWSGDITGDIVQTLGEVLAACSFSVLAGFALGVLIHRQLRVRQAIAPVLASWYAVPFFVFYPLLVALFGLNALPLIAIGVVIAVPAMMLSTLAGLDRVPARAAPGRADAPDVGAARRRGGSPCHRRRRICSPASSSPSPIPSSA